MKLTRKEFTMMAAFAALSPLHPAFAAAPSDARYEAGKKEGAATWYVSHFSTEVAEALGKAFTAAYPGITVNVVRATTQVIYQRLSQDRAANASNCDVFSSTDVSHYVELKKTNGLLMYRSAAAHGLDPRLRGDPQGYFQITSLDFMGVLYDPKKLSGAHVPTSWKDLLDAQFAGHVSVAHPAFSGYAGIWLIEMRKLYGDAYITGLAKQHALVSRSTIDTVTSVASGESAISAGPISMALYDAHQGSSVAAVYPKDGTVVVTMPTGILADTKHPNAAKLFVDWLMSSDGSRKVEFENFRMSPVSGATSPPGMRALSSFKILTPTNDETLVQMPQVIDLWRNAFGV